MNRRLWFSRALLIAAILAAVAWMAQSPARAAPAGAAQNLHLSQQTCAADGTVYAVLYWTPSGAGNQTVDIALSSNFASFATGGPFASNVGAVSFVGMAQGVTYYTRVNTATSSGNLRSDTFSFTASCQAGGGALTAPTGLSASPVSPSSVLFSWQRGNSNNWFCLNFAQSFNDLLYGGPTWRNWDCWTTNTSTQVFGLACGTTYYWNVFAWNDVTNGTSAPSSVQTPACTSNFTPPSGLAAQGLSPTSERLTWNRGNENIWFCVNVARNVSDILYGGPTWSNFGCWSTGNSLDLSGLQCNTTYYWNVYAWNNVTNGTSNYSTFTTQACSATMQPAPIDQLDIQVQATNPTSYVAHIVAGLPNGCHSPGSYQIYPHGSVIDIVVLNSVAPGGNCSAVSGQYELNINLGSNFVMGQSYTVNANDKTTTFTAQ
jgi:hypothetical protein